MIPAAFEYHSAKSLDDALRLLGRHGDEAKILAGGHSLLPMMKLRLAAPRYVIDIGKVRGLDYIREDGGHVAIGALATHAQVAASELLREKCPLLAETAAEIGDMQVRNRGTIGGSLAHADPAADYPASILALDAELIVQSGTDKRTIPAVAFFVDLLQTQIGPGEILVEVRVPVRRPGEGMAYCKFHQPASGFATVGAAARVSCSAEGKIEEIALGMTGVTSKAYRATATEKALRGRNPDDESIEAACAKAAQGVEPLSDIFASSEYRREMTSVFAKRAILTALARTGVRGTRNSGKPPASTDRGAKSSTQRAKGKRK